MREKALEQRRYTVKGAEVNVVRLDKSSGVAQWAWHVPVFAMVDLTQGVSSAQVMPKGEKACECEPQNAVATENGMHAPPRMFCSPNRKAPPGRMPTSTRLIDLTLSHTSASFSPVDKSAIVLLLRVFIEVHT